MRNGFIGFVVFFSMIVSDTSVASASTPTAASPFGNPVLTVIKLFLLLGVILALAVLSIRFLAKKSQVAQKGTIQVLAARQVAPNKSVQVIDVQGKRYLIGVGDQITLLADVTAELDASKDEMAVVEQKSFGKALADSITALRKQYQTPPSDNEGTEG